MTVKQTRIGRTAINLVHFLAAWAAAVWYRFPSKKLHVIGVTGTDGKSSSVLLIARVLREQGYRVGFFSSIAYSMGDTEVSNTQKMTTPGRGYLQYFLFQLLKQQCTHVVLEITSEGMRQYRHRFIDFDVVTITNITPEHIESHGGFEQYKAAKQQLLYSLETSSKKQKVCVQNMDDPVSREMINHMHLPVFRYGFEKTTDDMLLANVVANDLRSTQLHVEYKDANEEVFLQLGGPFIAQNVLCAIAVTTSIGVPLSTAKRALEKVTNIPGRFEIISNTPLVIVDYAHTINALGKILPYVRERVLGSIVHVFGAAGGGRDAWKRPQLAALSEQYADRSIITEENPFDEDSQKIANEIAKGFTAEHEWNIMLQREDAIRSACAMLRAGDCLLCTAKGSEEVIAGPNRTKRPYNERAFVAATISTWQESSLK